MKKYELDTPVLVLDLDRFEQNLKVMRDWAAAAGKKLRPHAKTHKCPEVARRQIAAGNCAGICTAKLSEAEKMVQNGIGDILITSPVVTDRKIARLIALNGACGNLMTVVDDARNVEALAQVAAASGKKLRVLVDVDPEMGRTGIAFDRALDLGKFIMTFASLELHGIQCYCGHLQHILDADVRREKSLRLMRRAGALRNEFIASGLPCPILTGTGTGTASADLTVPEVTDIQVGSYCMMDAEYAAVGEGSGRLSDVFTPALTLICSVIDVNAAPAVTVDAGTKAVYLTPHAPPEVSRNGRALPGWTYKWFGDEHGSVSYPESVARPELGDRIELILSHCDPTINLFDKIVVTRGDEVLDVWPVALRGCCQ